MNARTRAYLFGLIFLGVGIYQFVKQDYLEFGLYATAGTAFIFNSLAMEPKLHSYKKSLAIITWILIAATGILFLYLIQFKYL